MQLGGTNYRLAGLTHADDYDEGDLLQANPNHSGNGWEHEESEVADRDSDVERDDVETLVVGIGKSQISNGKDPE